MLRAYRGLPGGSPERLTMRVLVTLAVEAEFAPWRKLRNLQSRRAGGFEIFTGQIGRASVDFVISGMGIENARRAAEAAMPSPPAICIVSGFAGSLKPQYKVGDVLTARCVQLLGKAKTIECSRCLVTAAVENQAIEAKMFLTASDVVSSSEEKQRLSPFADAVDMESFAVLSAARERKISAAVVRVISDRFDEDMPVDIEATVDERGRVNIRGVVKHVALHPLQLPALIRLGRHSRTAAEALAHFLEAFLKELSFREHGWPPPGLQEVAAR